MSQRKDYTGQKFNYLTAIEFSHYSETGHTCYWIFKCDCGVVKVLNVSSVTRGLTKSCGCYNSMVTRERNLIHGMAKTKVHHTWCGIRKRCSETNKQSKNYKNYVTKGIKVCERWENFDNFLNDMGLPPTPKHSIDRIDNNGNYEPDNCRWVLQDVQNRNYSRNIDIEYNGKTQCLTDWCKELNLNYNTVNHRISRGWTAKQAFTLPKNSKISQQ